MAYVACLLARNGIVVIAPVISPYRRARAEARRLIGEPFIEVHVHAPLPTLEARDTKGLYALARRGELDCLTGVSDRYEPPERPDLLIETDATAAPQSATFLLAAIRERLGPAQ